MQLKVLCWDDIEMSDVRLAWRSFGFVLASCVSCFLLLALRLATHFVDGFSFFSENVLQETFVSTAFEVLVISDFVIGRLRNCACVCVCCSLFLKMTGHLEVEITIRSLNSTILMMKILRYLLVRPGNFLFHTNQWGTLSRLCPELLHQFHTMQCHFSIGVLRYQGAQL